MIAKTLTIFGLCSIALADLVKTPVSHEKRTEHTGCYKYFKHHQGSVPGGTNVATMTPAFVLKTKDSLNIAGPATKKSDPGACSKYYDSQTDLGVCLWNGLARDGITPLDRSGWLSGEKTSNCRKMVTVTTNGKTLDLPVVDGCAFQADGHADGCTDIWFTVAAFNELATDAEKTSGHIAHVEWMWKSNYKKGGSLRNAPV
ncbi:uncharacterized protein L969DRAFT_46035 [Mixia osmundae IAM 14324]|uniref:Ecp2 effector protein domain-containing protein n=1 Tax=Mixia osmundae (strain CBS 9802 / IAM 14324 / JCM 22182 / KY 12970) TaxID=764103 RepID=G7E5E1_MIXOS|nr:uncharacterized protein L969DRAFT_46035 [Mixia osmundae IAM 14324]KEI40798.1 hypothetical protein L969DRAFT_46035 [Mixia osmundae IAM 14324]GAA98051.1 hypothetical protein E5Q_04732 [Mixia osmundae IAM 14324]